MYKYNRNSEIEVPHAHPALHLFPGIAHPMHALYACSSMEVDCNLYAGGGHAALSLNLDDIVLIPR